MNGMEILEIKEEATTQAVEEKWYSLEELSQITGYGKDKLNHLLTEVSFVKMSKAHSKVGGYHNSQKFYDEYILKAIKAGWRTAKEMYEAAGVCRDTFNEFLSDVRNAVSKKTNSSCKTGFTTEKCITGPHNTKYYHPKVEEAFQLWLKKNAINAGGQRTEGSIIKQEIRSIVENSEYKYSKEDICNICNVDEKTFRRFFEEVRLDSTVQSGIITLAHNKKM